MQILHYILFLNALFIFVPSTLIGQDKTIDKVEMLYDQGNFAKVHRTTTKLQKEAKYKNSAPLILFEALAEYQLSKTKTKFTESNAISLFKEFIALDPNSEYVALYDIYIYDLQIGLVNSIRDLETQGDSEEAQQKFDLYSSLFEHQVSYKEITTTQPAIAPKKIALEDELEDDELIIPTTDAQKKFQKEVLKEANKHVGTPYKYGGITPKGFDCSGFAQYVMAQNNIELPRTSREQSTLYKKIKLKNIEAGDLIFFGSNKSAINHVGIISEVTDDKIYMIHSSTSRGVIVSEITTSAYWSSKIQIITRITEN